MSRYLLSAEADQIQDFIFRASRLREVVGGSQLLSRFCREGTKKLLEHYGGNPDTDIIVNDGGAFRILFDNENEQKAEQKAKEFGRDLAELYRRTVGGNITVADPVPYNDNFQTASKQGQEKLREAKSRGDISATTVHLPYLAFCASCGVAIATERYQRPRDQKENYYCTSCRRKEQERDIEVKKLYDKEDKSGFLGMFQEAVQMACQMANVTDTDIPDRFVQDADDVASFDLTGRRYVAYLLADGNGMGMRFNACPDEHTMRALSQALPNVLRASLAAPCPDLIQRIQPNNKDHLLSVLPLILGGDDLFALLPAPWAIHFAACFCCEYEQRLRDTLNELKLLKDKDDDTPTIAAAVVICKSNYPHTLAHRKGEELLEEAKRLARGLEAQPDQSKRARLSVLNFTLITGNEVGRRAVANLSRYHPTACPYFVNEKLSDILKEAGIPIQWFLKHRLLLSKVELPGKRRAEFEDLYNDVAFTKDEDELTQQWKPRCDLLLNRLGRTKNKIRDAIENALKELGNPNRKDIAFWHFFDRPLVECFYGHGLADLLAVWDYAYDLQKDLWDYEE